MNSPKNGLVSEIADYLAEHRSQAHSILHQLLTRGRQFLLRSDVLDAYREACDQADSDSIEDSPLASALQYVQEASIDGKSICLALRTRVGRWI